MNKSRNLSLEKKQPRKKSIFIFLSRSIHSMQVRIDDKEGKDDLEGARSEIKSMP